MKAGAITGRRGTPLAMLVLLLGGWVFLRFATWDGPMAFPAMARAPVEHQESTSGNGGTQPPFAPQSLVFPGIRGTAYYPPLVIYAYPPAVFRQTNGLNGAVGRYPGNYPPPPSRFERYVASSPSGSSFAMAPELAAKRQRHLQDALGINWPSEGLRLAPGFVEGTSRDRIGAGQEARPLSGAEPLVHRSAAPNRWLLDVYGFYRQGSGALSVTQGPQPIYGASQLAANLQWRAKPTSRHHPRVYARAYHALVTGGESELAAGVSALPIGDVPVRLYGELRATRNPAISDQGISSKTSLRPAAFLATEIPPQKLPFDFSLEAYGAGGYVAGNASTYFLDGQAAITRKLARISQPGLGSGTVSLGAAVWGGAQEGAQRVDIGPTLRFDVNIGEVPARVSVDYREKIAGDAEPDSGVAATVSTRF